MNLSDRIPDFDLIGTDHQQHMPSEYDDKEAVAIIFACNHCPHVRAGVDRINDLVDRYGDRVGFFAISSNDVEKYPSDSFEDMIPFADLMNLNSRYLYDESQDVARAFSAERTPEVFLFNKDRQLVYQGAFDDNTKEPWEVTQKYLENALEELLAGKPVTVAETQAMGCTVKWK